MKTTFHKHSPALDRENQYLENTKGDEENPSQPCYIATQTDKLDIFVEFGAQAEDIDDFGYDSHSKTSQESVSNDLDESFKISSDASTNYYYESTDSDEAFDKEIKEPSATGFIVYWSCLLMLFTKYLRCASPAKITQSFNLSKIVNVSIVNLICLHGIHLYEDLSR